MWASSKAWQTLLGRLRGVGGSRNKRPMGVIKGTFLEEMPGAGK